MYCTASVSSTSSFAYASLTTSLTLFQQWNRVWVLGVADASVHDSLLACVRACALHDVRQETSAVARGGPCLPYQKMFLESRATDTTANLASDVQQTVGYLETP